MRNHWLWIAIAFAGACDDDSDQQNEPPVAHDDHFVIAEDDQGSISSTDLRANDEHLYSYGIDIVEGPAHGAFDTYQGHYIPAPGYFGPDSFVYEIDRVTATVTIEITSDGVSYEDANRLDPTGADALAVGDFDGDGSSDVVVANAQTDSIAILVNRTTAPKDYVVTPYRFEGGSDPVDITVADLDGDGRQDVITASKPDGLVILRNITQPGGPLAFEAPLLIPESSSAPTIGVVAADIDGDGAPDLASILDGGFSGTSTLGVRLNASTTGAIAFGARTDFTTPQEPIDILSTDADGDGRADIAVLSKNTGELSLFLNATAIGATVPAFGTRLDRATANKPRNLFLADLDGDGDAEIAVMHDLVVWIYANRGSAMLEFEAARVLDLPAAAEFGFAAPIDLDGQGAVDVLAVIGGQQSVAQLFNNSLGAGSYMFDLAEGKVGDVATRSRANFGEPRGIVRVDLDGVAPAEIIVATRTANTSNGGPAGGGTYVLYDR